jgi:glycosyltransferase involved in cell wall biosynthesis
MSLALSLCATRLIKIAKMRIAFCSDSVPPVWDGVTRTISELVTTLADARVEFQFLSAVHPDPRLAWRDRVHVVPSVPFPLYPYYRLGLPVWRRLDRVLDRFAPDVVHVVTPSFLGLYGLRYARRRGIPVLASFHTDFVGLLEFYWLRHLDTLARFLARRFYGQCAATLVPSRHQAAKLADYGIQNVGLWRRGVDSVAFSPAFRSAAVRAEIGADGVPIVLYVGRLGREKNLHYLIAAIELLRRWGTAFKLVIVGQGPMRRKLVRRLPEAHFTGHIEGAELARWYASADVFVFPSTAETFGNVVLEAFASGLPVVGVGGGAVGELVTPNVNGLLAPADQPAAFAEKVRMLLERPADRARMAAGALATAAAYRWPDVNRQLLDHYERVILQGARQADRPLAVAV